MAVPKKVMVVAGARPNFMKVAPILEILRKNRAFRTFFVHTGQHYDFRMSEVFFQDLHLPKPDIHLNVGSDTQARQTGRIMEKFEAYAMKKLPDWVIVVGDVNSTLAAALASAKLGIRVAHVEAGLRSFDRGMPEEINRVATDRLSDLLFVSEESGLRNLRREGTEPDKVRFVGNVMIDSLIHSRKRIRSSGVLKQLGLTDKSYAVLTLHRPSNVDSKPALEEIRAVLADVCGKTPVVYPIHPRTRKMIQSLGMHDAFAGLKGLQMTEPLGYVDFVRMLQGSRFALTDSGGIQEETTFLKVPCLTMRENTERPVTLKEGTNELVGRDRKAIRRSVDSILAGRWKKGRVPRFWDGRAAERIVKTLRSAA